MKLKDCERCLVYGTDKRPLSRARVEVSNEGEILLYFATTKLRSVRFKTMVDLYDGAQGVVRCRCEVVIQRNDGPSKASEPWMAVCEVLKVQEVFQRQKDLRVPVEIRTEFYREDGLSFFGTIQNISAGGLFLVTTQALKKNEHLYLHYTHGMATYEIGVRVLRLTGPAKGGVGYGCQFFGLPGDVEAAIRKFVYMKQQEKLQRKLVRQ